MGGSKGVASHERIEETYIYYSELSCQTSAVHQPLCGVEVGAGCGVGDYFFGVDV